MKPNKWADWTEEEFRRTMLQQRSATPLSGAPEPEPLAELEAAEAASDALPSAVEWKGTGAVTPVKDQASCGSCWSFSATGAIEGALFVASGKSVSVSEQMLVDCSWDFEHKYGKYGVSAAPTPETRRPRPRLYPLSARVGARDPPPPGPPPPQSQGCDGGFTYLALAYVKDVGILAEAEYPYLGQNAFCSADKAGVGVGDRSAPGPSFAIQDYVQGKHFDARGLRAALYSRGPVAVSIQADLPSFRFYSEGVYDDTDCHGGFEYLDHAVLATGYGAATAGGGASGTAPGAKRYFTVKNSWSPYWGDEGYIKIAEQGNICGVSSDWTYAVAAPSA